MSIFDDGFDAEDAFTLGAAIGFAEESMQAEEEGLDEKSEPIKLPEKVGSVDLHIFRNTNPELFNYIVRLVAKQKREWRRKLKAMRDASNNAELRALAETEKLLEEDNGDT